MPNLPKTERPIDTHLVGGWLLGARLAWVVLTLAVFLFWLAAVLGQHTPREGLRVFTFFPDLGFFLIAAFIFWRRSNDLMGILVSLMLVFIEPYLLSGVATAWGWVPGWNLLNASLTTLGGGITLLCFYLFPNGQFVPRWTRPLAGLSFLFLLIASIADVIAPRNFTDAAQVFAVLAPVGVIAQIYRYRWVSGPVQRQQTKWVVVGFMGPVAGFFLWVASVVGHWEQALAQEFWLQWLSGGLMALLPIAISFSIFRYRLWDIDLIIRRTLAYSVITGLLTLVYLVSAVILQNIFTILTGQQSPIAVVLSTLVIAAIFFPVRRLVQRFIDRRFYRSTYDASKTLAEFSRTARDETNLDVLTARLVETVDSVMQPESIGLWLKDGSESARFNGETK